MEENFHSESTNFLRTPSQTESQKFHATRNATKEKLGELFLWWLSRPETQSQIRVFISTKTAPPPLLSPTPPKSHHFSEDDLYSHDINYQLSSPTRTSSTGDALGPLLLSPFGNSPSGTVPRSPKSPGAGPRASPTSLSSSVTDLPPSATASPQNDASKKQDQQQMQQQAAAAIPRFYNPLGQDAPTLEAQTAEIEQIQSVFESHGGQMELGPFVDELATRVVGIPKYLSPALFRAMTQENPTVKQDEFLQVHRTHFSPFPVSRRVFNTIVLSSPEASPPLSTPSPLRDHLLPRDFIPLIEELLRSHPGLAFLKSTPEFQSKYTETVITRIFFILAEHPWEGVDKITRTTFLKSDLCRDVLFELENEEDINKILRYFSYEHFYVLYCKFWELDADKDFLISKVDLAKYSNYALTSRCVERIVSGAGRALSSGVPGMMTYQDFCWFCLAEEDKSTDRSKEYWFRILDLDSDGIVSAWEMDHFWKEQVARMEALAGEKVMYNDILCQMLDMLMPKNMARITVKDVKRCKLGGVFFNVLFNLSKFMQHEHRDPFLIQHERESQMTEWERFARTEYERMAENEEQDDGLGDDVGGSWDSSY